MKQYNILAYLLIMCGCILESCEKKAPPQHYQTQEKTKYMVNPKELEAITHQQTVYVPVYSDIFTYNEKVTLPLTATLSIRNIDLEKSMYVTKIDYYDSEGRLLKKYIEQPSKLKALQTHNYLVEYDEKQGGAGANFIIEWGSVEPFSPPIFECVMISTSNNLGISFVTEGKVVRDIKLENKK